MVNEIRFKKMSTLFFGGGGAVAMVTAQIHRIFKCPKNIHAVYRSKENLTLINIHIRNYVL